MKKIHIISSVGSGKTTLARRLSLKLNIPFYELDNVVWMRNSSGDIRRSEEERDIVLKQIILTEAWIIEGVHHKWVNPSFQQADLIILLNTNYLKRTYRIIRRFVRQKLGIERANYKPTFKMFRKMFKWNADFERDSKPEIIVSLKQYDNKVFFVKDEKELIKMIEK